MMSNIQGVPTEAITACLAKLFRDILDGDNAVVNDYVVVNDALAAYMSATGQELLQKLSAIRWECGEALEAQTA